MCRYVVSDEARDDLIEIWATIAESNERAEDRVTSKIVKRFPTLAQFPEMGRARDDLAPGIKSVAVRPYVIFYRPNEAGVAIIRILHGARDLPSLFQA